MLGLSESLSVSTFDETILRAALLNQTAAFTNYAELRAGSFQHSRNKLQHLFSKNSSREALWSSSDDFWHARESKVSSKLLDFVPAELPPVRKCWSLIRK
jgi:hypothetical protein